MFGWREILNTKEQILFTNKKDVLTNAGLDVKIKHKYEVGGVIYIILVKKDELERARSLVYNK